MPTDYGFTGQRADAATGLDYYTSRYYDPLAGQFTSADPILPGNGYDVFGLSRFAYVEGNPENRIDPSGHFGAPAPIWPVYVPLPGWVPKVLLGGGGVAASYVGETATGGVSAVLGGADLVDGALIMGFLLSSSSGPPRDYASDPDGYQRSHPQRPDEQRRVKITPDRPLENRGYNDAIERRVAKQPWSSDTGSPGGPGDIGGPWLRVAVIMGLLGTVALTMRAASGHPTEDFNPYAPSNDDEYDTPWRYHHPPRLAPPVYGPPGPPEDSQTQPQYRERNL